MSADTSDTMTSARNLLFGFIAIVVIPALFFLALELGLRVLGFDKSFSYFHTIEIDGEQFYQDNPVFIEQFYPASLEIEPLENTFSAEQDENRIRVFVLGGSAARGFPDPEHGFSRILEAMLKEALPSREIEVINTAMTAINSHVVYEVARSVPQDSIDFAIVLMGNNEVIGPYGPGTFNQNFLSNLGLIRFLQTIKRSSIGQAMSGVTANVRDRDHKEELKWKGMQMFTNERVPYDDPRLETVYNHYLENLRDIVQTLQDKGAHVLLSTVPVNLRHSAPFASVHGENFGEDGSSEWQRAIDQGNSKSAEKAWGQAIDSFSAALVLDPDYADTHFSLAVAYENAGEYDKADAQLRKARDLDALRFRTDSRINSIVRQVATENTGRPLSLVDSEAMFSKHSAPGSPGWDLFLEHVHFNFTGDYLLAREFSRSLLSTLGFDAYEPLPETEVAERVGYPSNMTLKVMDRVVKMVKSPPFTGQSNQAELEQLMVSKMQEAEDQLGTVPEQIKRRQKTLLSGKGDWRMRYELAYLYEHQKNRRATYQQLYRLFAEYPHHRDSLVMTAKMLHQDEDYEKAIPYLNLALKHARGDEPLIAQLTGWLGLAHFKLGDNDTASEHLLAVARGYPDQIHYALQAYATLIRYSIQSGDTDSARDYAREVQRYAERLVSTGKDREYPMLYVKMSQMMGLVGDKAEARKWGQRRPVKPPEQSAAKPS